MNDNEAAMRGATPVMPDGHGRAALLLVESLIHGLCEASTLSTGEAIGITERAISVQADQVEEADGAEAAMRRSHALPSAIAASLKTDEDHEPTHPRLVP